MFVGRSIERNEVRKRSLFRDRQPKEPEMDSYHLNLDEIVRNKQGWFRVTNEVVNFSSRIGRVERHVDHPELETSEIES